MSITKISQKDYIFRYLQPLNPNPSAHTMIKTAGKPKKVKWYHKLKWKYRIVLMHDESLEERLTFRLTRMNVFIAVGTLTILLIFLTSMLIAFTPLREYIPGYTNVGLQKDLYDLQLKTDSIEKALISKDLFIRNLKMIISGEDFPDDRSLPTDSDFLYQDIRLTRTAEDSLLREDVENQNQFNMYLPESAEPSAPRNQSLGRMLLFTPLKGVVTNPFNPDQQHFGIDIVSKQNEAIKSVRDGTVIFSCWTIETGYVIGIQHAESVVSIYKHNSALLKRVGDIVKAGEVIAIIGETGELSSGPHLHFELWSDGSPVDPQEYISL